MFYAIEFEYVVPQTVREFVKGKFIENDHKLKNV